MMKLDITDVDSLEHPNFLDCIWNDKVKSVINAYVRELKKKVENKTISTTILLNLIKPINALFTTNDISFSWNMTSNSFYNLINQKTRHSLEYNNKCWWQYN